MKQTRKILAMLLCIAMVLGMATTVFAADNGSITIKDAANVSVAGKTFNAYKILNLELINFVDKEGKETTDYVYTVPAEMKSFYTGRYELTGAEGDFDAQVVAKIAAETDMFAFAAAALAAAKEAAITAATTTADENANSVSIENLPLGYYVIEDAGTATPISALMLDTTNPDVDIVIKADKPSIEKKIDGANDTDDTTEGLVDYNNAAIGDEVPYVVTSKVPDMTGYSKYFFVVNDTLSAGLIFQNNVEITLGTEDLTADEDYIVTVTDNKNGTTSVEIVFQNFIQYKDQAGAEIKITYSAIVDEDAEIGVEGNPNFVDLTYSNNPNVTPSGHPDDDDKPGEEDKDIVGKTPEDKTITYVTDLVVIKVDPNGKRLEGAKFKLEGVKLNTVIVEKEVFTLAEEGGTYWKLNDGTYTDTAPEDETKDAYASLTDKYTMTTETAVIEKAEGVVYEGVVGSDGVLKFEGLSAGEYKISELVAPDGYNLLDAPIEVKIEWAAPNASSDDCTWTYTGTDVDEETGKNTNTVTVINRAGTELPETGGIGTTLFYVFGGIMVLGAAVLLVTKKRMTA